MCYNIITRGNNFPLFKKAFVVLVASITVFQTVGLGSNPNGRSKPASLVLTAKHALCKVEFWVRFLEEAPRNPLKRLLRGFHMQLVLPLLDGIWHLLNSPIAIVAAILYLASKKAAPK